MAAGALAGHTAPGARRDLAVHEGRWHRRRMPRRQRAAVYAIVGALWISGCAWLWLDQFAAQRGPFGSTPHPLQPPLLLMHGVAALASMYLFGWISVRHVRHWWTANLRRSSGATLASILAVLTVTGFALFFVSSDAWQRYAAGAHDVLGVAVTLFAIQHWFFGRRSLQKGSR